MGREPAIGISGSTWTSRRRVSSTEGGERMDLNKAAKAVRLAQRFADRIMALGLDPAPKRRKRRAKAEETATTKPAKKAKAKSKPAPEPDDLDED